METNVILFFSFFVIVGAFLFGLLFGWFANEYSGNFLNGGYTLHPEMYDEDGNLITEQLIAFRFEDEEEEEEED
jgi:Protein of unknown function (DUF2973)